MNRNPKWINSKFSGDIGGGGYCAPANAPEVPLTDSTYFSAIAKEKFFSGKGSIIEEGSVYYVCAVEGYALLSQEDMTAERLKRIVTIKDRRK